MRLTPKERKSIIERVLARLAADQLAKSRELGDAPDVLRGRSTNDLEQRPTTVQQRASGTLPPVGGEGKRNEEQPRVAKSCGLSGGNVEQEVLMRAQTSDAELELLENKVRIKRKGWGSAVLHGFKGDKEILISRISSIQFKRPGSITSGYIQFTFMGGQEAKGGLFEAVQDENSVVFTSNETWRFEKMKRAIEERMVQLSSAQALRPPASNLDELEKLGSLREKGIVTEEEFQAKKKQLLGL